jgi:hypothetical protein
LPSATSAANLSCILTLSAPVELCDTAAIRSGRVLIELVDGDQ